MSEKTPPIPAIVAPPKPAPLEAEKPFVNRMQRFLAGQPADDIILDPDNPNLILERKREAS
ncbi:MAG: hypothetical protein HQL87_08715 [Magnetococcales bacterium]|nr:hypothetical protein [Magnetococcales bacterium]